MKWNTPAPVSFVYEFDWKNCSRDLVQHLNGKNYLFIGTNAEWWEMVQNVCFLTRASFGLWFTYEKVRTYNFELISVQPGEYKLIDCHFQHIDPLIRFYDCSLFGRSSLQIIIAFLVQLKVMVQWSADAWTNNNKTKLNKTRPNDKKNKNKNKDDLCMKVRLRTMKTNVCHELIIKIIAMKMISVHSGESNLFVILWILQFGSIFNLLTLRTNEITNDKEICWSLNKKIFKK